MDESQGGAFAKEIFYAFTLSAFWSLLGALVVQWTARLFFKERLPYAKSYVSVLLGNFVAAFLVIVASRIIGSADDPSGASLWIRLGGIPFSWLVIALALASQCEIAFRRAAVSSAPIPIIKALVVIAAIVLAILGRQN